METIATTVTITKGDDEKTFSFTFADRDGYLAYRAEWRSKYKELSTTIRSVKLAIKDAMRKDPERAYKFQWELTTLKRDATFMLDERAASKILAGRQYAAQVAA